MNMMTGAVAINGGVGVMEIHQPQVAVSQMAASAAQAAEQVALNAHITLRELKGMIDTVVEKKLPTFKTLMEMNPVAVARTSVNGAKLTAYENGYALGEYKLRKYLHERVQRPTSEYENEEMEANTDIYAEFIISTVERIKETCPHPLVMVEERLDYSYLVPSGFGTGDCVIIADGTLYVMDYKNGKGVFVSCDHNPQMMLYALGAYHAYGYLYNIKQVSMTIIQPRLENISTYECSVEELLDWAETYVRPRAKLAFEGKGEQVPGDWCRFCRARTSCKACAEEALALVKEEFLDLDEGVLTDEAEETDATAAYNPDTSAPTFKSPALLSKTDIEKMLPTLNRIESWIEAIFAYVSSEAINHGVAWDGYKVVEGRSKRQFLDTKSVVAAAEKAGYTDIYKTELISLTEFEKLMGKKKFKEILGEYVVKPPGKLALVHRG